MIPAASSWGMAVALLAVVLLTTSIQASPCLTSHTPKHRQLLQPSVIGKGFDPLFLGTKVGLPTISKAALRFGSPAIIPGTGTNQTELKYTYFSIIMNQQRRLAFVSAINVDGAEKVDLSRGDNFKLDPRLPKDWQAGPELYADNYLDRGHLTRSEDTNWGRQEEARAADRDSFYFTNMVPQHNSFNTGQRMWQGLENYYLGQAVTQKAKMSVFTGPIFSDTDQVYRGVKIPKAFYKLVVLKLPGGRLSTSAYIGNQTELIKGLREENDGGQAENDPRPPKQMGPDPWKAYLVTVAKVEELTGLVWDDVVRRSDVTQPTTRTAAAGAAAAIERGA